MVEAIKVGQDSEVRLTTNQTGQSFSSLLRQWRGRRRFSQMELALQTEISTRHLSYLETGRSGPSRDMVLKLAEQLELSLRDRNLLLNAAGFAPTYGQRSLDHAALASARSVVEQIIKAHEPNPALALDRHWNVIIANGPVGRLLEGVDADLLAAPLNVLRLSLHPLGLSGRILNLAEWREHLLGRLRRQCETSGDPELLALESELRGYPTPPGAESHTPDSAPIAVPFRLRTAFGDLEFLTTTTVFGTPLEVFLSELMIESFFPTNAATAQALTRL